MWTIYISKAKTKIFRVNVGSQFSQYAYDHGDEVFVNVYNTNKEETFIPLKVMRECDVTSERIISHVSRTDLVLCTNPLSVDKENKVLKVEESLLHPLTSDWRTILSVLSKAKHSITSL